MVVIEVEARFLMPRETSAGRCCAGLIVSGLPHWVVPGDQEPRTDALGMRDLGTRTEFIRKTPKPTGEFRDARCNGVNSASRRAFQRIDKLLDDLSVESSLAMWRPPTNRSFKTHVGSSSARRFSNMRATSALVVGATKMRCRYRSITRSTGNARSHGTTRFGRCSAYASTVTASHMASRTLVTMTFHSNRAVASPA